MSKLDQATKDYSREAVPDSASVSGIRITVVLVGAIITLPVFLVGAQLGHSLGLYQAALAFFIAGGVLAILAAAVGIIAANTRMTTWFIIQYSFGRIGARFVSAFIGITVLGWYGATVDMFARAVELIVTSIGATPLDHRVYLVLASILMVAIALFGFKGLDRLSKVAVPIMLLLLASLIYSAVSSFGIPTDVVGDMSLASGISAGIGGFIVSVAMFPDICRYARTPKDAVVAATLSYGIGVPAVLLLAAIPVVLSQEPDFLQVMLMIGLGMSGLVLLLLATWTTNAFNLYSTSLVFAAIVDNIQKWKLVILAGILGTLIALLPILDNFLHFLHFLAIVIPPVAGVYIADYFVLQRQAYREEDLPTLPAFRPIAFVSWIAGAAIGHLSNIGVFSLTTVPALNAAIAGFIIYVGLSKTLDRGAS